MKSKTLVLKFSSNSFVDIVNSPPSVAHLFCPKTSISKSLFWVRKDKEVVELNWNSFFVVSWLNVHNVWTDTQRTIEDQELRKEVFLQVKCFGKGLNRRDLHFEFDARLEEGISKFREQGINGAEKNGLFVPLSFDIPREEQLVGSVSTLS